MTSTDPAQQHHVALAWAAYDRIVHGKSGPRWVQTEYRTRCGTGCCYAGHIALEDGGEWLVDIRDGVGLIDGTPITSSEEVVGGGLVWSYMLATDDDPPHLVELVRGKRVIHVAARAAHLIGLDPDVDHSDGCGEGSGEGLFESGNTCQDLECLITVLVGPRP